MDNGELVKKVKSTTLIKSTLKQSNIVLKLILLKQKIIWNIIFCFDEFNHN